MIDKKIDVHAYAGYRGEEEPRSFLLDKERIEVKEILSLWIEEDEEGSRKRFFKVKGSDGFQYMLSYNEDTHEWFLRQRE